MEGEERGREREVKKGGEGEGGGGEEGGSEGRKKHYIHKLPINRPWRLLLVIRID